MRHTRIYLIGPMGAGKSTIGRQLAAELGFQFIDTDAEIEQRCGADIPWIFDIEGEEGFRKREANVLADISENDRCVIATGGGIVSSGENRKLLQKAGFVVYLQASIRQQLDRTTRDKKRPLLQVENRAEVLEQLMQEREPLYLDIADHVVATDKRAPKRVAAEIAGALSVTNNN